MDFLPPMTQDFRSRLFYATGRSAQANPASSTLSRSVLVEVAMA